MTMNIEQDYRAIIQERLTQAFSPSQLDVIDESDLHRGHAGHEAGGRHFSIVVKAVCFENISRVAAHRQIYALFNDLMPHPLHALKIKLI